MRFIQSVLLLLTLTLVASAEWPFAPLEVLVAKSDSVVVGTLQDVTAETKDGIDYGAGEILVEEVLMGDARKGQRLSLIWQNPTGRTCPRVEHKDRQGRKAIWLLKGKSDEKVTANDPGRFVELKRRDEVIELLRKGRKSNNSFNPSPR